MVLQRQEAATLRADVREHVEAGSTVYTDALHSYHGLSADYIHNVIDHAGSLRGWASPHERTGELLVAAEARLKGTYVSAWNRSTCSGIWTNRRSASTTASDMNDADRFSLAMCGIVGRR